MWFSRKKQHLVVFDELREELSHVTRALVRGASSWWGLRVSVRVFTQFRSRLSDHLEELDGPRILVLVAHGNGGRFLCTSVDSYGERNGTLSP